MDTTTVDCEIRSNDSTGYLQPICEHIVQTFDSYTIDPNKIAIEELSNGADLVVRYPDDDLATSEFDWVFLDCCYTGDLAVIEIASKTIIRFELGDR